MSDTKNIILMYIYQIMSNNFGYIDIILLAMIAGFIILRLRSILGRKTGHEDRKIYPGFNEREFESLKKKKTENTKATSSNELIGEERETFLKKVLK